MLYISMYDYIYLCVYPPMGTGLYGPPVVVVLVVVD